MTRGSGSVNESSNWPAHLAVSGEFWKGKRVTVTGGRGFLGKHVVKVL
jgi:hypothetical protein